jgi:hypothetical protein
MIRTLFASLTLALLLTGCADNPPPPRTSVPAPAPTSPKTENPRPGVHIDVPGAKVDVERKSDGTGRKVDVNVDPKR